MSMYRKEYREKGDNCLPTLIAVRGEVSQRNELAPQR